MEASQTIAAHAVRFGGGGRNRAAHARFLMKIYDFSLVIASTLSLLGLTPFYPFTEGFTETFTEGFPARLTWSQIGKDSLYDLFLMNDSPVT